MGREFFNDKFLSIFNWHVANYHNGLQIRAVPFFVETADDIVFEIGKNVIFTNGQAFAVFGTIEHERQPHFHHAVIGAFAQTAFRKNNASFLIDFFVGKQRTIGPVSDYSECLVKSFFIIAWNRQHIHGLIKSGVCIQVVAKSDADALKIVYKLVSGEVSQSVEVHVLHEVGKSLLIVIF
ncbi:hypothetical protein DSECCO2_603610 [anaerobic digester metagenome]